MAKVFISHCTWNEKCIELEREFECFLRDVLGLKDDEVFSSSRGDCIPAGSNFYEVILKEMNKAEAIVFLITEEFTRSTPCVAEIGAAWVLSKDGKLLIPLLESPDEFTFINGSPLMGIEGKLYGRKDNLESVGKTFLKKGISHRSPEEFNESFNLFWEEKGLGRETVSSSVSASSHYKSLDRFLSVLATRSSKSNEACYLLSCALRSDVLTGNNKANQEKSMSLLSQAREDGYPWAQWKTAEMILNGDIFDPDPARFEHVFGLVSAASKNTTQCPPAWIVQAWMLCLGLGCQRDLDGAENLCRRVPEDFRGQRNNLVAALSRIRRNKGKDISSLEEHYSDTQTLLQCGEMFLLGGCDYPPDFQRALSYYEAAAENGSMEAEVRLGQLYYYGLVDPDYAYRFIPEPKEYHDKAALHFHNAAEWGDVYARTMLGSMYRRGFVGDPKQDQDQAEYWYRLAADLEYAPAQYELGTLLGRKRTTSRWREAQIYLTKASCRGNPDAQCLLGDVYRFALLDCKRDMNEAARLYKQSAEQGNIVARLRLKDLK